MNLEAESSAVELPNENSQAVTFPATYEAPGSRPYAVPTFLTQENCEIKNVCPFKLLNLW